MGDNFASVAASIPSKTLLIPKFLPFILRNTSSSRLSRLTVILFSPESFKSLALSFKRKPLVVKVMSKESSSSEICLISLWRSVRSKGSPPVIRILFTPNPTRILVKRVISSKLNISSLGKNWYRSPNISDGIQ